MRTTQPALGKHFSKHRPNAGVISADSVEATIPPQSAPSQMVTMKQLTAGMVMKAAAATQ